MRVYRSTQVLIAFTTLASLAACGSMGRHQSDPNYVATSTVQWDSGPLDQAYKGQRSDMDARHTQEVANPRAGESSDQMKQRQDSENKDLDSRYAKGKASHSNTLPPADKNNDSGHQ
jgi:predicted small lipoprotein YifL